MPDCPKCGNSFAPTDYSGDFCPACADSIRHQLGLSARLDRFRSAFRAGAQLLASDNVSFVTLALVTVNVGLFVAVNWLGRAWVPAGADWLFSRLVLDGQAVLNGQVWRLLTGTILHFSLYHLAQNVLLLVLLGWPLERRLGHSSFFVLWLTSGLFESLAVLIFGGRTVSWVGSSGVVFGFLGAWLALYAFGRLPLTPARRLWRPVLLAALLTLWFTAEWLLFRRFNIGHLGGTVAGILLGATLPPATAFSRKRLVSVCGTVLLAVPASLALAWQVHGVDVELDQLFGQFHPRMPIEVPRALVPDLERIVARHPHHARAQYFLAEAYLNSDRYVEAIAAYRKALALQPIIPEAWYRLGIALSHLHRFPEAADAFSRSVQMDPSNRLGHEMLASSYDAVGRTEDALRELQEICELRPKLCEGQTEQQYLERLRSMRDRMFGPDPPPGR